MKETELKTECGRVVGNTGFISLPDVESRFVYLDHAATTPVRREALDAMMPYFAEDFGNPSALYAAGRVAKRALQEARETIARGLSARPNEIIFTAGGTESNNLALFGVTRGYATQGNTIITSSFEHHAVLYVGEKMEKDGLHHVVVPVDHNGLLDLEKFESSLTPETLVVSIMYANNEIGVVQNITEIARIIRNKKKEWGRGPLQTPFLHTDACQATQYLNLNVQELGVDLMTINSSKIYGPKGVGALYVKNGIKLSPLVIGGGQEQKLRSGTENIPGIVGFAKAFELALAERETESARLSELRDYFISRVLQEIPKVVLNGDPVKRLPNNINVSILDIEGEAILLYLDAYGICASTGSACDSASLDPSHVILALGRPYEFAHGSMRFTLGKSTTKEDIDYTMEVLKPVCAVLRQMSPIDVDITSYDQKHTAIPEAFLGNAKPHFIK